MFAGFHTFLYRDIMYVKASNGYIKSRDALNNLIWIKMSDPIDTSKKDLSMVIFVPRPLTKFITL